MKYHNISIIMILHGLRRSNFKILTENPEEHRLLVEKTGDVLLRILLVGLVCGLRLPFEHK